MTTSTDAVRVISNAAGRLRLGVAGGSMGMAAAVGVEDAIAELNGVRAVHAYPRTGSVVVWFAPTRCDLDEVRAVLAAELERPPAHPPTRLPHSADVPTRDILRMALGGGALALLGTRRLILRRPLLLGPGTRLFATAVTIITGYPFLRGALATLRGGRSAGTDLLVSAATVASPSAALAGCRASQPRASSGAFDSTATTSRRATAATASSGASR